MEIRRFEDTTQALRAMTYHLMELMERKSGEPFNLALSGGETAKKMFSFWVEEYADGIRWDLLRFFWVDERCVPPTDPESNYGHAERLLFSPLQISGEHVFRIWGENDPVEEAERYSRLVGECVPVSSHGISAFNCVILGVGNDLHTASIFPGMKELLTEPSMPHYSVSSHPQSGQQRVTMTGCFLLSDTPVLVPVVGEGKEQVISSLQRKPEIPEAAPAAYILSLLPQATVYSSV